MIRLAGVLMIIAALSAALLGFSNEFTSPIIAERHRETMETKMFEYFPEANEFEIEDVNGEEYYVVLDEEDVLGVAGIVEPGGYGGVIEMMVAMDVAGTVTGIEILSHSETPGISDEIEDSEWQEQFVGLTIFDDIQLAQDVEAVSGATASSEGVTEGVRKGIEAIAVNYFQRDPEDFPEIKEAPAQLEDGVFEGEGFGTEPGIEVEVNVSNGEIIDIELIDHNESETYMEMAWEEVPEQIIEENSPKVDTVSRATQSSLGIMEAVQNAIVGLEQEPGELQDGTYQGEGSGHSPGVIVEVAVSDGEITDMELIEHDDSSDIMESAWEGMQERILDSQSTDDVDTVSGATQSSYGIIEAVEEALQEAEASPVEVADGVYRGEASGRNPGIEIEVTILDGEISQLELIDHEESSDMMNPAWETLKEDILDNQSTDVDVVSGATQSSNGIIKAVENALDEESLVEDVDEKLEEELDEDTEKDTEKTEEVGDLSDGSFTGSAVGYSGDDIEIEVTVENESIVDIELLDHQDTEDIMEKAWNELPDRIIDAQSLDVDTVSGATYSSEGILEAVDEALEKASE